MTVLSSNTHLDVDGQSKVFLYYFYQSVSMYVPALIGLAPACHVGVHWTKNICMGKVSTSTYPMLGERALVCVFFFICVAMHLIPCLSIGLCAYQSVCCCSHECTRFI